MNATPRFLSPLERNTEFLATSLDEVYLPCSDSRAIPRSPSQLQWRLDFPRAPRVVLCAPRRNSRIPPQLEKNHEVAPSSRDEALSHCSISREVPHSLLKLGTVLNTLYETQEVPRHTHPHSSGTPIFLAHLNLSPFAPPHLEMRVDSSALSGKESRSSRRTSRGGQSHIET